MFHHLKLLKNAGFIKRKGVFGLLYGS
ncbi:MAG: hypothetical protein HY987_11195 [Methanobacterium sp.]|nr:hypothetical protein [Methanobacterium sp.]